MPVDEHVSWVRPDINIDDTSALLDVMDPTHE